MKRLIVLFCGFCCLGVGAQGVDPLDVMLDLRVDGRATGVERGFEGHTFKVWFAGEVVPGVRYRVRHRLNRPTEPLREGFSGATDHAWVAFDFGAKKQWTVMAGKQSVQFGTFEYDYNPADVYLPTMCFNDLDAYKTGVNVAYRFAGQTLNVQVINSDSPQFAREEWKNKALAVNVLWEGSLWNDAVKTRWAYGAFQHSKNKFYGWVTAGVQLNVGEFTTELDYYDGERTMEGQEVKDRSAAVNVKYRFGKWRPQVKGTWNERRDVFERSGLQVAVEYFPFDNAKLRDLRLHAAYTRRCDNDMALIGMRWLFKAK